VALTDKSSVGEARRAAVSLAQNLGFDEGRANDIGIVATEAANNVVLHAKSGELLICPTDDGVSSWLDLFAIDSGPGIPEISRAMEDGFSSIGTAGQGLGAIGRLSDMSSLYSLPEKGTVYWSRFIRTRPGNTGLGVVSVPVKGETTCGDGYLARPAGSRSVYVVVDGLGHGPGASEAAEQAIAIIQSTSVLTPTEMILRTHDALKKTRGAAMSVAVVNHDQKVVQYAGVGNISASLVTGTSTRALVSQNGTLGAILPRVPQEYTYPIERNTLLIMFSDGLVTKTGVSAYPGIYSRHPALIAGLLYRDFSRRRDDATVLVARLEEARA
jgi:anti-sigma regulatory factor (Ser/Thr protein kinase)